MKKWWHEINEIYFRKPLKEELEIIEPSHLTKLLNLYKSHENKNNLDSGNN